LEKAKAAELANKKPAWGSALITKEKVAEAELERNRLEA
jgi:hypothetical protein